MTHARTRWAEADTLTYSWFVSTDWLSALLLVSALVLRTLLFRGLQHGSAGVDASRAVMLSPMAPMDLRKARCSFVVSFSSSGTSLVSSLTVGGLGDHGKTGIALRFSKRGLRLLPKYCKLKFATGGIYKR